MDNEKKCEFRQKDGMCNRDDRVKEMECTELLHTIIHVL